MTTLLISDETQVPAELGFSLLKRAASEEMENVSAASALVFSDAMPCGKTTGLACTLFIDGKETAATVFLRPDGIYSVHVAFSL